MGSQCFVSFNMATRSLIIDLFKSPNGTSYGVLIAVFIVVLTTGFASNLFICCYRLALWIDFMLNLMSPIRSMTCALWSVSLHWSVRWSISIYIKGKALSKLSSLKFRIIFLMTGNRLLSVAEIKQELSETEKEKKSCLWKHRLIISIYFPCILSRRN